MALESWSDAWLRFIWNPYSAHLGLPWFFLLLPQDILVPHPLKEHILSYSLLIKEEWKALLCSLLFTWNARGFHIL